MASKFRFARAMAMMAGAALALSACGGVGTSTGGGDTEGGTLTYWSMWKVGEPQQLVLEKAIVGQ